MIIQTNEKKHGTYIHGQIKTEDRIRYYKEVIRYLSGMRKWQKFEQDLTVDECRITIDELIGNM